MHCPTIPEAEWTTDGVNILCICKQSAAFSCEKYMAARKCSVHTLRPVFLVWCGELFVFKKRTKEIQDLTRCNVHRFYTPLALSSQRDEVPKHVLKGKGMLQAMQLKPFQMVKEGFCVVGQLFWNG